MRVVDAEAPSHRVRLALDEHVGVAGGYSLTDSRGLHSVDHDVDLMLFDRDTDMTPFCIQVRDSEVEFKQAMTQLVEESVLLGSANNFKTFVTAMTDTKTWMFQRVTLNQIFAPERVTVKLGFDANGKPNVTSLRRFNETLHGFLLMARDIPAEGRT